MLLPPASAAQLSAMQLAGRREAVEKARRSRVLAPRLAAIRSDRLEDDWTKIALLTKEELRALSPEQFLADFCIAPPSMVTEWWRSGGVTGKPFFYGRSTQDLHHVHETFQRVWLAIGARPGESVHVSFPLGIHPVGQIAARAAQKHGMSALWAGAGNTTPSELQLELIQTLKPTIWAGMSSYCLHLANLAEVRGIDLAELTVRKIVVSAEQLTEAKRAKIARTWGAEVYDCLGMTEGGMMMSESAATRPSMIAWADMFYFEVVDERTGEPVPDGEPGSLVVTPLFTNNVTPFLRWKSGDYVTLSRRDADPADPFSVLPLIRHAHRTSGFFKIRGVNVNHTEFEDFMFNVPEIADFRAELVTAADQEVFRLIIEVKRDADRHGVAAQLASVVRQRYELTPEVVLQQIGTLAKEFESSVKAPRFTDRREIS
jgi:phenylacetate-CoA ligase